MSQWVKACAVGDIDLEDVKRFHHAGRTFAIYRSDDDKYFASDGLCTHEKVLSRRRAGLWMALLSNARCTTAASTTAAAWPRARRFART